MTIAQTVTTAMAIEMWSFFARTAPPTAIDADTPHTAPAAPSVAPNCGSSLKILVAARKIVSHVHTDTIVACRNAIGPAEKMSVSGRVAPRRTMPTLM